jgi:xylulokinase
MAAILTLGIDSGTQGSKAVVFDWSTKQIIAEAYATHELTTLPNGGMEQDPQWWIESCLKAIKAVLQKSAIDPKTIKAIGVSGQQHGFVPLDKAGTVIRPAKLWCDTATSAQCETITQKMGGIDQVIKAVGNSIAVGFTASKILWLKEKEPENYQKLDMMLLPHDYLNYWLTGEKKTEYGDASGTAYFDVKNRCWSKDILNSIDESGKLNHCLPELIKSEEPVGIIRKEIAEDFGFSTDVIVSSGGGDNMIAAIGTGNVADGVVTASLGTSGTIYANSTNPIIDPKGELAGFCSSTSSWLPLVCTMNVTVSTELTRLLLGLSIQELNQLAEKAPVGSEGIILLPYFNGERTPALPQAKATLFGINSLNYTQENLSRSAMEGATFGLKYGMDVLQKQGIKTEEIRLVGGGSKSAIWRQIVADILGCPVICPVVEEAGALGAALQAVWCFEHQQGSGISLKEITDVSVKLDTNKRAEPIEQNVTAYSEIFDQYLKLNTALKDIY